jgi:hypothetical protein
LVAVSWEGIYFWASYKQKTREESTLLRKLATKVVTSGPLACQRVATVYEKNNYIIPGVHKKLIT